MEQFDVYIAGPMTGYPQFNFPAFEEAARTLRALGIKVISPAEMDEELGIADAAKASTTGQLDAAGKIGGNTWGDLLARDVKIIADQVKDGVVVLQHWERSKGAKLEVTVALLAGKHVYQYHTGAGVTELDRTWVKDVLHANL